MNRRQIGASNLAKGIAEQNAMARLYRLLGCYVYEVRDNGPWLPEHNPYRRASA